MKILFTLVCLSLTSVAAHGQSLSEPPTPQPPTIPAFACVGSGFGESWAYDGPYDQMLSGEPFLGQITAVQMKPGNSQIIFASGNTSGMFKSIDGGLNWYSVTDQLQVPGLGITDIAFRQDDPNVMFATTGEMSNQYGNYSLGLISSGDEGETWQYIMNLGEQVSFSNAFHDNVLSCITINPLDDNELIVGGFKKIYQSIDGGDSWTFFDFDETIDNTGNFYISDVEFDPTNNDIVFVSTKSGVNDLWVNLWVSEDHGDTWQIRNPPTTPNEVIRLDLTDAEPTFTYCAVLDAQSKLDIYKTDDAGITWLLVVENLSANVNSSMG